MYAQLAQPGHDRQAANAPLIGTAKLIDGATVSNWVLTQVSVRAARLAILGKPPCLAVVLVGDDSASTVYVRDKIKACERHGVRSVFERRNGWITEDELLSLIAQLNADPTIHGILVQMPLPRHIDPRRVVEAIDPGKDVDGFSVRSAGELMNGVPGFLPCTPTGCMRLIQSTGIDLKGKHAVVVGRSSTVGKPMALLLLQANATVTVCHSATAHLGHHTRQADVVVVAVGRPRTLTADMVKPGAVVIDVGIHRDGEGKLCGDVDFDRVSQVAGWITPVPGGVGPMTISILLANTIEAADRTARQ
jgi:methylenetetrahydrofolate dehydrogenase (NADP+)/methenyltetrahydrofolate cyclohydrolase